MKEKSCGGGRGQGRSYIPRSSGQLNSIPSLETLLRSHSHAMRFPVAKVVSGEW
jgi:hypothetical protein